MECIVMMQWKSLGEDRGDENDILVPVFGGKGSSGGCQNGNSAGFLILVVWW